MDNDTKKEEVEEIRRRIDYLMSTSEISVSEKIVILKKALEIIEQGKTKEEVQ